MSAHTSIEWTDRTWNPVRGCSRVSEGCRHCYAEGIAARFSGPGQPYEGLARFVDRPGERREPRWSGEVRLVASALVEPLRWRKPQRVFVNSMSDLFHESLSDDTIDKVFAVMALCPSLTFQVLTKRPERMRSYLSGIDAEFHASPDDLNERFGHHCIELSGDPCAAGWFEEHVNWALPNVWLGVSVEDQRTADERIPILLDTPAAVRFISAEPLLGPVDLCRWMWPVHPRWPLPYRSADEATANGAEVTYNRQKLVGAWCRFLDWVIVGGESGPGARPMHPDWVRSIRDQCDRAGVPFFFKQWGEWAPVCEVEDVDTLYFPAPEDRPEANRRCRVDSLVLTREGLVRPTGDAGKEHTVPEGAFTGPAPMQCFRVGKSRAGRALDGCAHDAFPEPRR